MLDIKLKGFEISHVLGKWFNNKWGIYLLSCLFIYLK